MNSLRELYEKLPENSKDQLFSILQKMLYYREHQSILSRGMLSCLAKDIADLIKDKLNKEIMVYT